jgi:polyferredoxin
VQTGMNEPLKVWAKLFLRLAIVLLAVGLIPVLAVGTIFTEVSPLVPVMLSFLVAPLGALSLLVSLILFLAAALRRPRGSS